MVVTERFGNFLVDSTNWRAVVSARHVLTDPRRRVLLISGPSGSGKTKLLTNLAECNPRRPAGVPSVISAEEAHNELLYAYRKGWERELIAQWGQLSLLCFDGLEFFTGYPSMQTYFAGALVALRARGARIATAVCSPSTVPLLQDALLHAGAILDSSLTPHSLELQVAILQAMTRLGAVPRSVLEDLARDSQGSTNRAIGSLRRLEAQDSLHVAQVPPASA